MKYLLDTHVYLWWDLAHSNLNSHVRDQLSDAGNDIYVSAATVWEITTKRRTGKLRYDGPVVDAIVANGFALMPVLPSEAETAGDLDWDHRDPFDRLLIAQAMNHSLTLITADRMIRKFGPVSQIWAS